MSRPQSRKRGALAAAVAALALLSARLASQDLPGGGEGLLSPVSASAIVTARVVSGLGIRKTQDLEVGTIRVGTTAGSVTVGPGDPGGGPARTASGGVTLAASGFDPARFTVSKSGGVNLSRLQVSLPSRVVLGRIGGSETVTARDFVGSVRDACRGAECDGAVTLAVGATLDISANQPAGRYVGTFNVTVNES
jgi:hypothetical protein